MHELLPIEILMLQGYLTIKDVSHLHIAICDINLRALFLHSLRCVKIRDDSKLYRTEAFVAWVTKLHIKLLNFKGHASTFAMSKDMKLDAIEVLEFYSCSNANNRQSPNTNATMSNITKCGPTLKKLDFSRCPVVKDITIRGILEGCPILRVLNLSRKLYQLHRHLDITDFAFIRIAECYPMLEVLNLSHCCKITDIAVVRIAECCPLIRVLSLECCYAITDIAIIRIAECCPMMQALDLSNLPEVGETGYMKIVECCSKLRRLSLSLIFALAVFDYGEGISRMKEINPRLQIFHALR
jgi:hypothetical protein